MEMFLMGVCISLFGLAVTAAAFGSATQHEQRQTEALPEREALAQAVPAHFFGADTAAAAPDPPPDLPKVLPEMPARVPIEALLLQIDNHVRLEQAAAESFLQYPTTALLHSRTCSPLVH